VTGLLLVPLLSLDNRMRQQARDVYEAGFPAALRAPFRDLVDVQPGEHAVALVQPSDRVLGLALVRDLPGTRWTFLRYFVVAADRRGTGLGTQLWAALTQDLVEQGRTRLTFDVEDPDDADAADAERAERLRRIRFYQRLGATLLPVTGYAPPAHGEGDVDVPLRLLAAPLGAVVPPPLGAELADLVRAVYAGRYGLTATSPTVTTTLRRSGL
jgi:GNAT superfamily N-acetyltransferase